VNEWSNGYRSDSNDTEKYLAAYSEKNFLSNSMKILQMVKNAEGNGGQRIGKSLPGRR
jgi:hypothetical protein